MRGAQRILSRRPNLEIMLPPNTLEIAPEAPAKLSGAHIRLVLWKAARAMDRYDYQSIQALDLCPSDFAVLEVLLHKGPLPVNQIGRKVELTSGSITTAVDRLQKRGLVERRPDAGDGRVTQVHLTSKGRELVTEAYAEHAARLEKPVDQLDPEERRRLIDLLKRIGYRAEELSEDH